MRKIIYIFKRLFLVAPLAVIVTIDYYICNACVPAVRTILYAEIFQGVLDWNEQKSMEVLLESIGLYLAIQLGIYLLNYAYSVLVNTGVFEKGNMHFRMQLQRTTTRLSMYELEDTTVLDKKKRAEQTIEEETLVMVFYQTLEILTAAGAMFTMVCVICNYHWGLAALLIFTAIPVPIAKILRGRSHVRVQNAQAKAARRADYYWKLLTEKDSVKELRVLGCEEYLTDKWKKENNRIKRTVCKEKRIDARVFLICDIIKLLGYFGAFASAVLLVVHQQIEINVFGAILSALPGMQSAMEDFMDAAGELPELLGLSQNYEEYRKLPECQDGTNRKNKIQMNISMEKVFFKYPNAEEWALSGVDLVLKQGQHIAVVGENGSGKSTLLRVLLGIYPAQRGGVLVDGTPIEEYEKKSLYRNISMVSQKFVHYYLTLRENVGISDYNRLWQDEEISAAMEKAGFREPVLLEEQLGAEYGGREFSVGQWQKLAIARAFFKEYDFIVMDEPTSALDAITEVQVLRTFLTAMTGKTAVVISHRIGICSKMDCIIVMKNGCVAEVGNHKELLQRNGEYAKLYQAQAKWYTETI